MTTPAPKPTFFTHVENFLLAAKGWAFVSKSLPNWAVVAVAVAGFLLGRLI